jgi:hypothetical protein
VPLIPIGFTGTKRERAGDSLDFPFERTGAGDAIFVEIARTATRALAPTVWTFITIIWIFLSTPQNRALCAITSGVSI